MPSPPLFATERVFPDKTTSATDGRVVWAPAKSLWLTTMTVAGVIGGAVTFSWDAVLVFVALTAITICAGHSVGMHRLLIHRSFRTPIWIEHILVWLGTLVGMAGPLGMIRAHDMRDWHQRQAECPDHPAHRAGFWRDAFWQMHCDLELAQPPRLQIEPGIANDRFYRFLDATWMAQQMPVALVLWLTGGWGWVFWGVCLRVAVSLHGHWIVGHFAHRQGQQSWRIEGLPVQGYDLPGLGLVTFGENWHGNHHAFPHSAQLGIAHGQWDPGFLFIRGLALVGLARDIQLPDSRPEREGLVPVSAVDITPCPEPRRAL